MSDFKPGDINTDTGYVDAFYGGNLPYRVIYALKSGKNVVLSGKLGVASFSVFRLSWGETPGGVEKENSQKLYKNRTNFLKRY